MRGQMTLRAPLPVTGVRLSLWRAAAAFRVAALAVCVVLIIHWRPVYARPGVALAAGAGMAAVTAVLVALALSGRAHRPGVVGADVLATVGLTLLSVPAQTHAQAHGGMVTLTTIWAAGPAIEAGFLFGAAGGLGAALVQFASAIYVREGCSGNTLYSGVLLVVAGTIIGFVATLVVRAEDELRTAATAQAALAERERLARSIHDGVLQVLGLVHRAGRDAGGEWGRLAAAAAEQEERLRALITSTPVTGPTAGDLAASLRGLRAPGVTVSTPAAPVPVSAHVAGQLTGAVRAALANVEQHAGPDARAWVLLEEDRDALRVTVRDDGAGFTPERLAAAAAQGRLGVARSVRGRIADLGGTCTITAAPGQGTLIEMVVPHD